MIFVFAQLPAVEKTTAGYNRVSLNASLLDLTDDPGTIIFCTPLRKKSRNGQNINNHWIIALHDHTRIPGYFRNITSERDIYYSHTAITH